MRLGVLLITLGTVALVGDPALFLYQRRLHNQDVQDIHQLHIILDSARAQLSRAVSAADSATLTADIRGREEALGFREFHVPMREASLAGWWRLTGPGVIGIGVGALLLLGGLVALRIQSGAI